MQRNPKQLFATVHSSTLHWKASLPWRRNLKHSNCTFAEQIVHYDFSHGQSKDTKRSEMIAVIIEVFRIIFQHDAPLKKNMNLCSVPNIQRAPVNIYIINRGKKNAGWASIRLLAEETTLSSPGYEKSYCRICKRAIGKGLVAEVLDFYRLFWLYISSLPDELQYPISKLMLPLRSSTNSDDHR